MIQNLSFFNRTKLFPLFRLSLSSRAGCLKIKLKMTISLFERDSTSPLGANFIPGGQLLPLGKDYKLASEAGLPDDIFANKKTPIWLYFGGA
jgi:hypothetical protein